MKCSGFDTDKPYESMWWRRRVYLCTIYLCQPIHLSMGLIACMQCIWATAAPTGWRSPLTAATAVIISCNASFRKFYVAIPVISPIYQFGAIFFNCI